MFLCCDFGTSSLKLSLIDRDFKAVSSAKAEYFFKVTGADFIELDPGDIINAFYKGVSMLGPRVSEVEAIGFDAFSPSLVLTGEDMLPISPLVTHLDRRSREQSRYILKVMPGKDFQSITGVLPFAGGVTITTILWFIQKAPELFSKAKTLMPLTSFIFSFLTGRRAADTVNASMTGLYETIKGTGWSEDILKTFSIPRELLPDVYEPGEVFCEIKDELAAKIGVKPGTPVFLGTNDMAVSQIGADNLTSGKMLNVAGSSEMISILTDNPVINDKYYLRRAATPGLWQMFSITAAGFVIDWFKNEFCRDLDSKKFYNEFMGPVIKNGLDAGTVRFLPYLAGDRHSLKKRRGSFTGMSLETSRENLFAALLRGLQEPIVNTLNICSGHMTLDRKIMLTGGLVDDAYLKLKEMIFPGFVFDFVDDCAILGDAKLAARSLDSGKSIRI